MRISDWSSDVCSSDLIDRPDGRAEEVLDEVFDLFVSLEANDEQLDFPTLYASGRNGYAGTTPDVREGDLSVLFETILSHIPAPKVDVDAPFTFLTTLLDRDNFLGRIDRKSTRLNSSHQCASRM